MIDPTGHEVYLNLDPPDEPDELEIAKALITELCDALEKYLPADVHSIMLRPGIYREWDQEIAEKCQRAREATR